MKPEIFKLNFEPSRKSRETIIVEFELGQKEITLN